MIIKIIYFQKRKGIKKPIMRRHKPLICMKKTILCKNFIHSAVFFANILPILYAKVILVDNCYLRGYSYYLSE